MADPFVAIPVTKGDPFADIPVAKRDPFAHISADSGFRTAPAEATAPPSGHQSLGGQFVQGLVDYPANMAKDVGSLARLVAAGPLGAAPIAINMSPEERSHAVGGAALALGAPAEKLVGGALERLPVPALAKRLLSGAGAWAPVGAVQSVAAGRTAPGQVLSSSAVAGLGGAVGHVLMGGAAEPASPMMPPTGPPARLRDILEGAQGFPKAPPAPEPVAVPHPVGALTVRGKAGPLVTPEPGDLFHGTANPDMNAGNLDASRTKIEGLFGQGVYMTDDPKIAAGYARARAGKNGVPVVYKARLGDMKFVDMEKPASPEVLKAYQDAAKGYPFGGTYQGQHESNVPTFDAIKDKPGVTPQELHRALSEDATDISQNDFLPASEFYDAFGGISDNLRGLGYEGLQHTGGLRVGNKLHRVTILTDPQDLAGVGRKPEVQSFEPVPMGSPYRAVPMYATPQAPPDPFSRLRGLAPPPPPSNVDRFMAEWDAHQPVPEAPTKPPRTAPHPLVSAVAPALDKLRGYEPGGPQAADLLDAVENQKINNIGHARNILQEKTLPKVGSPEAEAVYRDLTSPNAETTPAGKNIRAMFSDTQDRAVAMGHLLQNPHTGALDIPFPSAKSPSWVPETGINPDLVRKAGPERARMVRWLMEDPALPQYKTRAAAEAGVTGYVNDADMARSQADHAERLIASGRVPDMEAAMAAMRKEAEDAGRPFRGPSVTYVRKAGGNPFRDRDATRMATTYLAQTEPTLARTQVLGPKHDALNAALARIKGGGNAKAYEDAVQVARHIETGPRNYGWLDKFGRATSGNVIGLNTTIEHVAQAPNNVSMVTSLPTYIRALAMAATKEGHTVAVRSGALNHEFTDHAMQAMGGEGGIGNLNARFFRLKALMAVSRKIAADAGVLHARDWAKALAKNPENAVARYRLSRLGLDPAKVAERGLTQADEDRAAIQVVNESMGRFSRGDLPHRFADSQLARNTLGRLRSFMMFQPTTVLKNTVGEMRNPGGGRRALRNLAYLATINNLTGEGVNDAKAWLQGKERTKNLAARMAENTIFSASTTGELASAYQAIKAAHDQQDPAPIVSHIAGQPAEWAGANLAGIMALAQPNPPEGLSDYQKSRWKSERAYRIQQLYGHDVPGLGFVTAKTVLPTGRQAQTQTGAPALIRKLLEHAKK